MTVNMEVLSVIYRAVAKLFVIGAFSFSLLGCWADPGTEDLKKFVDDTKRDYPGKPLDPPPKVEPYEPFPYTPLGLKDPFALPEFVQPPPTVVVDNGIRPDEGRAKEELENYALGSLQMVGTFDKGGTWALINAPDIGVQKVQVGNYMGFNYGKIVDINNDQIKLLEIVSDGTTGWIERDQFLSLEQ